MLIPTLPKRAELLQVVVARFHDIARRDSACSGLEILTISGTTWGEGCNQLARAASGDVLFLGADDALPADPLWFSNALAVLEQRQIPAARFLDRRYHPINPQVDAAPAGVEVGWTRLPLLYADTFREVGPLLDATWYADHDYSERLTAAGWPIVAAPNFSLVHLDGDRGWLTEAEHERSQRLYEAAVRQRQESAAASA